MEPTYFNPDTKQTKTYSQLIEENKSKLLPLNVDLKGIGCFLIHRRDHYAKPDYGFKQVRLELPVYDTLAKRYQYEYTQEPMTTEELMHFNASILNDITNQISSKLDEFAKTKNYDSFLSACSYVSSTSEVYRKDALRAVELRDATWAAASDIMNEILTGKRKMIFSLDDIIDELPELTW